VLVRDSQQLLRVPFQLGRGGELVIPIRKREHKFIEEQIFNMTYTDEQRGKEEFAVKHPGKWNPYGSLPQMRLLTYQMPDELLAIASAGEFDEFDLNEFFAATGTGKSAQFKLDAPKKLIFTGPAHLERPFHQYHDEIIRWYDLTGTAVHAGIFASISAGSRSMWPRPQTVSM